MGWKQPGKPVGQEDAKGEFKVTVVVRGSSGVYAYDADWRVYIAATGEQIDAGTGKGDTAKDATSQAHMAAALAVRTYKRKREQPIEETFYLN